MVPGSLAVEECRSPPPARCRQMALDVAALCNVRPDRQLQEHTGCSPSQREARLGSCGGLVATPLQWSFSAVGILETFFAAGGEAGPGWLQLPPSDSSSWHGGHRRGFRRGGGRVGASCLMEIVRMLVQWQYWLFLCFVGSSRGHSRKGRSWVIAAGCLALLLGAGGFAGACPCGPSRTSSTVAAIRGPCRLAAAAFRLCWRAAPGAGGLLLAAQLLAGAEAVAAVAKAVFNASLGFPGEGPEGLRIATLNVTAWASWKAVAEVEAPAADIWLLQEHKLTSKSELGKAKVDMLSLIHI